MIKFKDIHEGDTVRVNSPDYSEHGKLVVVEEVCPEVYQKVWARTSNGEKWWFMLYELEAVPEKWWEGIDTSTMDYVEYAAFEDAMTNEEYQQYTNREGE